MAKGQQEIAVESGKIIFLPVFQRVTGPMAEFCLHLDCTRGQWSVFAHMTPKPKPRIDSIRISKSPEPRAGELLLGHMTTACPTLFVGDPTFVYSRRNRSSEGLRAFGAARRAAGGRYRTDAGQVAIALRLGTRGGRIQVATNDDITLRQDSDPR